MNVIEGTDGNDYLAVFGEPWRFDGTPPFNPFANDMEIFGYKGADYIAGGEGNDILDGGEEDQINKYGRDVFIDENTPHTVENSKGVVTDEVFYLDDPSGITANFETGVVADGYGSIDTVLNFERAYGSFHDDTSHYPTACTEVTTRCMAAIQYTQLHHQVTTCLIL